MKRFWTGLAVLVVCSPALAQPLLYDDFNGNKLLPHWVQPPPSDWTYNVSNGMLNVTGLHYSGGASASSATIGAFFALQTDFRADVWMGWEAGARPHALVLSILGPSPAGPIIAQFGYLYMFASGPEIMTLAGANFSSSTPAPAPGMYQFTISRTGTQFDFFLNGNPFASFPDQFGRLAGGLTIDFAGPTGGQLGTLRVDWVQVVPAPASAPALLAGAICMARRRRSEARGQRPAGEQTMAREVR